MNTRLLPAFVFLSCLLIFQACHKNEEPIVPPGEEVNFRRWSPLQGEREEAEFPPDEDGEGIAIGGPTVGGAGGGGGTGGSTSPTGKVTIGGGGGGKVGIPGGITEADNAGDNRVWDPPVTATAVDVQDENVTGLQLLIKTGKVGRKLADIEDDDDILPDFFAEGESPGLTTASTDTTGLFVFDICPTPDFENATDCFRARFNDSGFLRLNTGAYETINFFAIADSSVLIDSNQKQLTALKHSDLKYFRLSGDPSATVHDAWFLQGVEIKAQFEGEAELQTIYRNPGIYRWIENEGDNNFYSPMSIYDDAYCFYFETGTDSNDEGTNDTVSVQIPFQEGQNLEDENPTMDWIMDYSGIEESTMLEYHSDAGGVPYFVIPLRYSGFDDFGSGNEDYPRNRASYCFTVFDGRHRLENKYQISIKNTNGGDLDDWRFHRVRAYYFKPGNYFFLNPETARCAFDEELPNVWLGDSFLASTTWPSDGYKTFESPAAHCPSLKTIDEPSLLPDNWFSFGVLDEG